MTDAIIVREIEWTTPGAADLRAAMDREMGALYADFAASLSEEVGHRVDLALQHSPSEMVVVVGAFEADVLVGHAALRLADTAVPTEFEVKRVFVAPSHRGRGVSRLLMSALEAIAARRGATSLVLQTGDRQREAIALYERIGYSRIEPFGRYAGIPFFLCYRKDLTV
jgi:GNAT superfamily N-acetyltransferase